MGDPPLPKLPSGDDPETIALTHDEVLILFELFERLEEENGIAFAHPAEWSALGRFTAQLEYAAWEVLSDDYQGRLTAARTRRAEGFEGHVHGLGHVRVEPDGTVTPTTEGESGR